MKRLTPWALALLPMALVVSACGDATLEVSAEVDLMDPETNEMVSQPVSRLEVWFYPFDRDVVFDSLSAAATTPEPGFPEALIVVQDSLFEAQETQRLAESEWLALRERLGEINQEMAQFSPAEGQYRVLFAEFNDLQGRVDAAERRQNQAFQRVEELRSRVLGDIAEARILQEQWEDEAFRDYFDVEAARLQETRREIRADTTDATGQVRVNVRPGTWWVHARHRLPTEELYWNIRVDAERGDPIPVRLNRETTESRRVF